MWGAELRDMEVIRGEQSSEMLGVGKRSTALVFLGSHNKLPRTGRLNRDICSLAAHGATRAGFWCHFSSWLANGHLHVSTYACPLGRRERWWGGREREKERG